MNVVKVNKSRANGMSMVVPVLVARALGGEPPDYMSCELVDGAIVFRPLIIQEAIRKGK